MSVDIAPEVTDQFARRDKIRAYRAGRYILIVATGELPTPGYDADIEPSPLRIYPQQYNLLQRRRPGMWPQVVTPYTYGELFVYPEDQPTVTVHHADGQDEVDIEQAGQDLAEFSSVVSQESVGAVDEATGLSSRLSFDEAFADALANLPVHEPSHPDEMTSVKVTEVGALFGGIAGFRHLYVKVQSTTA